MEITELIHTRFRESIDTKKKLLETQQVELEEAIQMWIATYQNGGKLMFCGNGGSASDSQHIATELMVRLKHDSDRPAMPAIALTTDTSLLTAGANDLGFDQIFARQVEGIGKPGDLLIALSTSGNSANVVEAVKKADHMGIRTLGLLGNDGGMIKSLVDTAIVVPHTDSGRIQESHILLGHVLCEATEQFLYGA